MNKKELIEKIGSLDKLYGEKFYIALDDVLDLVKQLDKPQKVTIPQFIADWIKYCKNTNVSIARALLVGEVDFYNYANQKDLSKLTDFFSDGKNQEIFARAWLDGYTVEEEKRYIVRLKNIREDHETLNCEKHSKIWNFSSEEETILYKTKHTRKELEEAGLGWVFDCPGIEIEEVTK